MKKALTPKEITAIAVVNISNELQKKNWSLLRLSEESGVPYDTVKKLLTYRIDNPHMSNLVKIASALDCTLDNLIPLTVCPDSNQDKDTRVGRLMQYMTELEKSLAVFEPVQSEEYLPVLSPIGNRNSGGLYEDSCAITAIPIGQYRKRFGDQLSCAIRVTTNSYHPVYYQNDILLIGKDRMPLTGETGVFVKDGYIYLRKFISGNYITLAPVNHIGTSIYLESLEGWFIFGYVLTVYRA